MATVIKRVDSRIEEDVKEGVQCCGCGTGTTKHVDPTPCRCGKTMEPYTFDFSRRIPGYVLIRCNCGAKIECSGFTTSCPCGRVYNWNGDELAPTDQWGDETGEKRLEATKGHF
ncbi:hypothetical protein [Paenibacillus gansuensis]|uniref:Uncharacterized protein n=1 Tax=Paenibacillus gansuensis TaxID=306542 RepID=A0ABW5PKR9_9BACL